MGSYGQYLKAAATSQVNLVIAAGVVVFSALTLSTTLLPWFVAGEVLWLGIAPFVPAFRRLADAGAAKRRGIDRGEEIRKIESSLPPDAQRRFASVAADFDTVRARRQSGGAQAALLPDDAAVDGMLQRYARLLASLNAYTSHLAGNPVAELQRQRDAVDREIAGEADAEIREAKTRRKETLDLRIDRLRDAERQAARAQAQVESFEEMVRLLGERALVSKDADGPSAQLGRMMDEMEATEQALSDLDGSFDQFDRALGSTPAR